MKKFFLSGVCLICLTGCAPTKSVNIASNEKIKDPKIISITSTKGLWPREIEKRLRNQGFIIKKFPSQKTSIEQQSLTMTEVYRDAATRYVLQLDGYAPSDTRNRCLTGGGYDFEYIDAELIDMKENTAIFSYSNSGFSEGCLLGKHIFGDIENLMVNSWEK